jgi:prevent-host-death family protein
MSNPKVGAYHAKTHLAQLLDRVERGERITITRHGRAVAELRPPEGAPQMTVDEAIAGLREFRDRHPLGPDLTIKKLIDEGRRF